MEPPLAPPAQSASTTVATEAASASTSAHAAKEEEEPVRVGADGRYHCRYANCGKSFEYARALHTHHGWHKRMERQEAGVYDMNHRSKRVSTTTDKYGQVTEVEEFCCDHPGCTRTFQTFGALYTHQGWHKRRAEEGDGPTPWAERRQSSNKAAIEETRRLQFDLTTPWNEGRRRALLAPDEHPYDKWLDQRRQRQRCI